MVLKFFTRLESARRMIIVIFSLMAVVGMFVSLYRSCSNPIKKPNPVIKEVPIASDKIIDVLNKEIQVMNGSSQGIILHNIPQEMTVNRREIIEVRVAKALTTDLTQRLAGNGDIEISKIQILPIMGANLVGTQGSFDIHTKNLSEEKTSLPNSYSEWIYEVTPLESGRAELFLTVYLIATTSQGERKYELPTIKKDVLIHPHPIGEAIRFVKSNAYNLVGILISLGVVTWFINKVRVWRERKTDEQKTWEKVE